MLRSLKYSAQVALLLAITLIGVGCDSGGDDKDPSLSGRWLGTATIQGGTLTVDVQMSENNGAVTATGFVSLVEPVAVSGTGTYNFPNVSVTLRSSGIDDMNFSGTLGADGQTLAGTMNASGFANFGITLRRQ